MILFVLAWRRAGGLEPAPLEAAVRSTGRRLPFLGGCPTEGWRSPRGDVTAAWMSHPRERVGGASYVSVAADRLALFAGRPVLWGTGGAADGRSPLHATTFQAPCRSWAGRLDGRCVVARYQASERTLEVWTDPLGAYPLFRAQAGDMTWLSNNAALLRGLHGGRDLDPVALAGLLGGGWPLDGHPVWNGVRRVPRGAILRLSHGREPESVTQLGLGELVPMLGAGLDPVAAGRTLVELTRALADWPGRPSLVPVTGGRDSRLVLAAALAAGLDFETATGGAPESPDVVAAARLSQAAGIAHSLLPADSHGDLFSDPRRAAELLALSAGGTASLADATGFPMGPGEGPLPLWHSGQGGEVARGYYGAAGEGRDALTAQLYRRFVGRRPGRVEPLSAQGRELVERQLAEWVDDQLSAGADPVDVPDLFYLLKRMGTWAGPTHGAVEWVRDTTSPLWSRRMLPYELGLTAGERAREHFHLRVLRELAPELVAVPFADGFSWTARRSGVRWQARRARALAAKGLAEARRRARRPRPPSAEGDPFARVQELVGAAAASRADHPAWEVLDRPRVDELLARPPSALDTMSRYYVWRLATVLLAEEIG